jgi:hypothetical protein
MTPTKPYAIRLRTDAVKEIERIASGEYLPLRTLLWKWILERLQNEKDRAELRESVTK